MAFGIGGSFGKSHSSSSSTTNTSGSSTTDLTGLSTTKRFDDAAKALLDAFSNSAFDEVADGESQYTRENAITDASGVVNDIFRQYREQALPEIYSAQGSTGAYNSSAAQLLANDAYGSAVSQSAQVVTDNIARYAELGQNEQQLAISSLLDALKLQGSAYEQENVDQTSNSIFESTSNTRSRGSSSGFGIGGSASTPSLFG